MKIVSITDNYILIQRSILDGVDVVNHCKTVSYPLMNAEAESKMKKILSGRVKITHSKGFMRESIIERVEK